jgi:hypothetical protein
MTLEQNSMLTIVGLSKYWENVTKPYLLNRFFFKYNLFLS